MSISARNDGTIEAVYILLTDAKAVRTREVMEDILLADYDSRGHLVGIEVLAPVKMAKLAPLVDEPRRRSFRRFIRQRAPEELILT